MNQGESGRDEPFELHRIEEETGFKPNQLVVHKITKIRGRVKGYFKEGDKTLLVINSPGMSDKVVDIPNQWEKLSDN